MLHFFLEYAVFFVIVIALIAVVLLFTLSRGKGRSRHVAADRLPDDAKRAHQADNAVLSGDMAGTSAAAAGARQDGLTQAHVTETETALAQDSGAVTAESEPAEALVVTQPAPVEAPATEPTAAQQPSAAPVPAATTGSDELLQMKGVGPKLVARLHELGITRFDQIAAWDDADVARIDGELGNFRGRIRRDDWIDQARLLAAGDRAAFEAKYGSLGK
ncbi:hypothetical protein [Novosphingopyxis sp.]|uniref:hypothetical protein n=1 Tax=Novosphingopyxis sp. TaxID=2709690 RepID=UPI003B58D61D